MMYRSSIFLILLVLGQSVLARPPQYSPDLQASRPQTLPLTDLTVVTASHKVVKLKVQTALMPEQQEIGLMWRKSMPRNEGMLFVFPEARQATFWMRNTLISLDLLFIQSDGRIVNIAARATPLSEVYIPSKGRVIAVLEIGGGRARALRLKVGQRVCHATLTPC
jgi:uncharacterized protein